MPDSQDYKLPVQTAEDASRERAKAALKGVMNLDRTPVFHGDLMKNWGKEAQSISDEVPRRQN